MTAFRAGLGLRYRRLRRDEFGCVAALRYDQRHLRMFLAPVDQIVREVQEALADTVLAIESDGVLAGFIVLHPDGRDRSTWWVTWLAVGLDHQGNGIGRRSFVHAVSLLSRIPGCRRVRLLVAPDNAVARRLYGSTGFVERSLDREGWLLMEYDVTHGITTCLSRTLRVRGPTTAKRTRRRLRLRPCAGAADARTIGSTRAPPDSAMSGCLR